MHDINEGVMPFLMKTLFSHCLKSKVFSEKKLKDLITTYDFGYLNSKNKPSSNFNLDKKNLGQNAAQSKCLFEHIPYIFSEYQNHPELEDKWICVQSLLQISQIVYSSKITEYDLEQLEKEVDLHLRTFKLLFNVHFIPKQHFMVHYARVLRSTGPLVHMSMARFESKHKFFKNQIRNANNFVNMIKTMAVAHQQYQCRQNNTYEDIFKNGRLLKIEEDFYINHREILDAFFCDGTIFHTLHWFRCNSYDYKNGLIISYQSKLYEIYQILYVKEEYHFLCIDINVSSFNKFLNSLEITESNPKKYSLIHFKDLVFKSSHEKKKFNGEDYIMATTLEVPCVY